MSEHLPADSGRRKFLVKAGQAACACLLGGTTWRVFFSPKNPDAEFDQPRTRYAWQINPDKCTFCGKCATACVRKPSAVKAVNDQKKCSFCVVCYGHIIDQDIDSSKIDSHGKRVCPNDAVSRRHYSGGPDGCFIYTIDDKRCIGCGKCAKRCNGYGTKSMFLLIRPDLCLGCNECAIADACPSHAIERVHLTCEDDFRGEYGFDDTGFMAN